MFGYLRANRLEMSDGERAGYNSVYCGFCKALGGFGSIMRFTLSYDFTFYCLLSLSLSEDFCGFEEICCPARAFKKCRCVKQNNALTYAASLAVMMLYAKLCDNIADGEKLLYSRLFLLYIKPKYKKAVQNLKAENEAILSYLKQQEEAEKSGYSPDRCAHPTASTLSFFFSQLSKDAEQKQILERLGYVLGRWIYILDAVDDLEKDLKGKRFNPLKTADNMSSQEIEGARAEALAGLNVCISEAQDAILNLELYHFKPVIHNIIFSGLKNTQYAVFNIKSKKERTRYLSGKSV